ncbi:MAG: exopolysaccharide biosynthesis protein, partial [Lactococcus sp.]|nr:exopolysaccharide biosynthesis protein [Lactococcus sp.]
MKRKKSKSSKFSLIISLLIVLAVIISLVLVFKPFDKKKTTTSDSNTTPIKVDPSKSDTIISS